MTPLVQSACLGCRKRLRIPMEWLYQPIRCKHCGMVMEARKSGQGNRNAPVASITTKPQAMPVPVAKLVTRPASMLPVAPLAIPVAHSATASPFSNISPTEEDTPLRNRRKRGSQWRGMLVVLSLLAITGMIGGMNWDRIASWIPADDDEPVAQQSKDKEKDPLAEPPTKKTDTKSPTTPPSDLKKEKPVPDKQAPKMQPPTTKKKPPPPPPKKETPKPAPPQIVRNDPSKNPPPPRSNILPRRALVISVHDYLYANPIQNGPHGASGVNFHTFIQKLNLGLNIPLDQIAHLSDDAVIKDGEARAPTKAVIEKTLTSFLESSRQQDRILVFFVGHAVELNDEIYLAPIEGELDRAETLIPLKWFYEQLAKCKARQKVLVLDGNRYNQTFGQERPGGDEMGPKLDAMLQAPPPGVQVWSSCSLKQRSFAADAFPMGIFLESLTVALQKGGVNNAQKADDPLPLERYVERVNQLMKEELSKRKLEQVSRLSGKEAANGPAYDPNQPRPPEAIVSLAGTPADVTINRMLVESVLDQIGTPPVKVTHEMALRYDALPPFPVEALQKYQGEKPNPDSPLRKAVKNARAVLWAIYPGVEPRELSGDVSRLRAKIRVQLNVLKDGYRAPGGGGNGEKQFKDRVENDERAVALLMRAIDDTLEDLQSKEVVDARKSESARWKANYDFILARMELEYAYLFEYQSMLGSMRKEFPPRDAALHGGWKLASQANMQGDSKGKKLAKDARKLLDKIIKDNAGSPWEVVAKREKLTNLGLEWQPAR